MEFRTKVPVKQEDSQIAYTSKVLLVGSCFVENIGMKLDYYRFPCMMNPFGILFNPAAIERFLKRVGEAYQYDESDVFYHNESWHCFEAHSALSSPVKRELLDSLNTAIIHTRTFLAEATHVIVTPGTAWAYRHLQSGQKVANCHKVPQEHFRKELLDPAKYMAGIVREIRTLNPEVKVIFTISPVRHLRDGFVENQRSKARLISAIQDLLEEDRSLGYFPSYEILMDELRDYRFYGADMIHPSEVAVKYIWERFRDCWINPDSLEVMDLVEKIQKGRRHVPFHPEREGHQRFLRRLEELEKEVRRKVPGISL